MRTVIVFACMALALATTTRAADKSPRPGEGGGGASCKYCKYNPWGGIYECRTSTFLGGRQGDCEITYHMGGYLCKDPTGPLCILGEPVPDPVLH